MKHFKNRMFKNKNSGKKGQSSNSKSGPLVELDVTKPRPETMRYRKGELREAWSITVGSTSIDAFRDTEGSMAITTLKSGEHEDFEAILEQLDATVQKPPGKLGEIKRVIIEVDNIKFEGANLRNRFEQVMPGLGSRASILFLQIRGLPRDDFWRLFIDKEKWNGDPKAFDRSERGYHDAMMNGLDHVLDTLGEHLNATSFIKLHDIAVAGVTNHKGLFKQGLTVENPQYGIRTLDALTSEGEPPVRKPEFQRALDELKAEKVLEIAKPEEFGRPGKKYEFDSTFIPYDFPLVLLGGNVLHNRKPHEQIVERLNTLFDNFYQETETATDSDDKLRLIVKLVRALEVGHYFSDGNQRTNAFLLLNKLLLENGFTPAILEEPSVFDGYLDLDSLIIAVKVGMENFQSIANPADRK